MCSVMNIRLILITFSALTMIFTANQAIADADIVYRNGKIYTVDGKRSWAQAVAIEDGKFAYVGKNRGVKKHIGKRTKVVDLEGAFVMPGLNDLHVHAADTETEQMYYCKKPPSPSLQQLLDAIEVCASNKNADDWVLARGWEPEIVYNHKGRPIAELLDEASGGRPVVAIDSTYHHVIVSTKALQLVGVDRDTPDPKASRIYKDTTTGEPTGLLESAAAVMMVVGRIPLRPLAERAEIVRNAVQRMNRHGYTGFKDAAVGLKYLQAYHTVDKSGGLTARVATSLFDANRFDMETFRDWRDSYRSERVDTRHIKISFDGVSMTKTALMLEPYPADEIHGDDWYGEKLMDQPALNQLMAELDKEGFMVKMHAAGDGSVRMLLNAVEHMRKVNGDSGIRHECSHTFFVHPDDIKRFSPLDVIAEFSPVVWHPIPGMGKPMGEKIVATKDLLDTGTLIVTGTDWATLWPTPSPWAGLEAMITRQDPSGVMPGALWPEQAVELATTIEMYTINGAEALRLKDVTGSIEVNKSADFIVLDRNLFEIDPEDISETQVLETVFEGKTVYQAD